MTRRMNLYCILALVVSLGAVATSAWSNSPIPKQAISRRAVFQRTAATVVATTTAILGGQVPNANAASNESALLEELQLSQQKLQGIPQLLQDEEWDKVRTILKTPPVNKLWNLGDSQNTVLKLAKESGNVELFELKDDLAYNLQMCDQLTYDNVFVYFQPGNGKIKIKEPTEFALKAIAQINQILEESK